MKVVKLEKPYAIFGTWEVFKDGTIKGVYRNPQGKESVVTIYADRLTESDMLKTTVDSKLTSDIGGFVQAWLLALELKGIKELKIKTGYE